MDDWNLSVIDKVVGQQYSDNTNTTFYKLGAYNQMDFKGSYSFSNYEFSLGLFNVLNSRSLAAVTINDASTTAGNVVGMPAATGVNDYAHRLNSLDGYSFQAQRSIQFTARAQF
jgi:outer membrane receptor protein involved in Fe transport